jgi:F0F1-type ATP synthase assembly protein I
MVSAGLQVATIVGLFVFIGVRLDAKIGTTPWCTLGGSLVGIGLGLYGFLAPFLKK